ncbi:MAG TPA: leucine-rich repeat domain-containing protein [Oligoflexus sp.]|uniref:leucine-rich repeat domain-containing protein n=1 Tax=Oligoflexus sp. TaxID=1971216 RepID=UPI002D40608C|nr:leucine-rich repeat domain-containing protein [Oligoflexus sp.]HYX35733.1 leucine-rich repeat domain-containing protein [Oligoflexus sp.]
MLINYFRILLGAQFVIWAFGCDGPRTANSSDFKFFENSIRRDPDPESSSKVVKLEVGCTAFFVENMSGKAILATAAHCFRLSASGSEEAWCAASGSFIDNNGDKGTCKRIIAGDPNRDIMFFEANYSKPIRVEQTFRLATYDPSKNTRLNMLGYPADRIRNGKITLTENCWIVEEGIFPPAYDQFGFQDPTYMHNCSTYGGNSGGPIYVEGSRDVIGMPSEYSPGDYSFMPSDFGVRMNAISDFVAHKKDMLEAEGIAFSTVQPIAGPTELPVSLSESEEAFVNTCSAPDALTEEQRKTLNALKSGVSTEDCSLAAYRLSRASELNLVDKDLTDLGLFNEPIFENSKVAGLFLQGNRLGNLDVINGFKNLRYLELSSSGVTRLSWIGNLPKLKFLNLDGNGITDLKNFFGDASSSSVVEIRLNGNSITDVSYLKSFNGLLSLSISNNRKDPQTLIRSIGKLPPLHTLTLRSNAIKSLDGFETAKVYNVLDLSYNEIESISELSKLEHASQIAHLRLSANKITDVSSLSSLIGLETLDLAFNRISNLSPLASLKNLSYVLLGGGSEFEFGRNCPFVNTSVCRWLGAAG